MSDSSEAKPVGETFGPSPIVGPSAPGRALGQVVGMPPADFGIIIGAFLSGSGILVGPAYSGARVEAGDTGAVAPGPLPPASEPADEGTTADSDFVVHGDSPGGIGAPGSFDLAFRREVAAKIRDILVQAYSTRRHLVSDEARRRNVSVEHLLAAYLARVIMEKVDREYL